MKKIKNILLIFSSLIFLELASQFIISFYGQKNYSFLLKPFSNYIERYSHNYEIAWDYSKNKMKSGTYLSNQRVEYTINSRGFRGREFEVKKKYKRITCTLIYRCQLNAITKKGRFKYDRASC